MNEDVLRNFGGTAVNDLNNLMQTGNLELYELSTKSFSPYKTIEQIPQYFNENKNKFCAMSLNCQSLNAKYDKLRIMLDYFKNRGLTINAVVLQETWIGGEKPDFSLFNLPGYGEPVTLGATCGKHGGLAIYLSEGLNHKVICKSNKNTKIWEGLFISVNGESLSKPVIVGNIYKPPRDNNNNNNIELFMSQYSPVITRISKLKSDIIILGDTNIDLLQLNHREKYADYLDFMLSNGYLPKISFPTKFSNQNVSLYDHIFYKSSNNNYVSKSCIVWSAISDHFPCITNINHIKIKPPTPRFVKIRKSDENSIKEFVKDLEKLCIYDKMNKNAFGDPNMNYEILENAINECRDKHLPVRTVKFNKYKHENSDWITTGILRSLQFRDKLYLKLKKTSFNSSQHATLKQNLKTYNTILNKLIMNTKKDFYRNEFAKYKNDVKTLGLH